MVDPQHEFAFDLLAAPVADRRGVLDSVIGRPRTSAISSGLSPQKSARRSTAVWTGPPIARHFAVTLMRWTGIWIGIAQMTVMPPACRRVWPGVALSISIGGVALFDLLVDEPGDALERLADAVPVERAAAAVVMIRRSWARLTATLIRFGDFRKPATVVAAMLRDALPGPRRPGSGRRSRSVRSARGSG